MTLNERNKKIEAHNQKVLSKIVDFELPKNRRFKNLSGLTFGKLLVVSYLGKNKLKHQFYYTRCECGSSDKIVTANNLRQSITTSCGCYREEVHAERLRTHGLSKDPWYQIAIQQEYRMNNPEHPEYHNYGGRGLKFGEGMEKLEQRIHFYRENLGQIPIKGLELDKTNNDLGYGKKNVRLVSKSENNLNRRDSHGFSGGRFFKTTRIYSAWESNKRRGNLCDEWAADFKVFLADIGGRDLPKDRYLARYDVQKPFGPDNYYFSDTIQRRPSYLMQK